MLFKAVSVARPGGQPGVSSEYMTRSRPSNARAAEKEPTYPDYSCEERSTSVVGCIAVVLVLRWENMKATGP